ncbi:MAG: hypothetical protein HXX09_10600 [Bacteroidetes bacterium]|nr:hypothetical protein [Bacteroidota bacterium]
MKKNIFLFCFLFLSQIIVAQNSTNDFYDDDSTHLFLIPQIEISGEVSNPGVVDFSKFILRSEMVKEGYLDVNNNASFRGAYRYDGYSLYDILNNVVLNKKNAKEFNPIIDLYVEIENSKGEKVVFSWGEIFYPVNRHKIFIATQVARIVPTKTKKLWPLPTENKVVVATDLYAERNISNPTKITIKSYSCSIIANKEMEETYSKDIVIMKNDKAVDSIIKYPQELPKSDYSTIFYGRGRGLHGIKDFKGVQLKNVLEKYAEVNKNNIKNSIVVIVGKDGYRAVFTYSELFNRNDFMEVLLIDRISDKENGAFSIFPASDYFSDRAVKSISEIRILDKF